MSELPAPKCTSDVYRYIGRIIEDALKQTEQILMKLKTRRDDTTINVKNKTVRLNEINTRKNKSSTVHVGSSVGYNAERILDNTLPAGTTQYPGKTSSASWQIIDLLSFPVDDEERNLRLDDRVFTSLDQKSIMLMREYDYFPNHAYQQQQHKVMDLQQRHVESDQGMAVSRYQQLDGRHPSEEYQQQQSIFPNDIYYRQPDLRRQRQNHRQQLTSYGNSHQQQMKKFGTHRSASVKTVSPEQFQQPHQRVLRIQKPKVHEYGRVADKDLLLNQNLSTSVSYADPLNAEDESKSISKEDDSTAESSVELEKVSEKLQKTKSHREERKPESELKPHREKPSESSSSFQVDEQRTSSGSSNTHNAGRSASDTFVHCPEIKRRRKQKKKVKTVSTLERELAAKPPSPVYDNKKTVMEENEMSDKRWNENDETGKRKKGRKNKKQQIVDQQFITSPVPKLSHSSMVDPMGYRKVKLPFVLPKISAINLTNIAHLAYL
uniref:JmjC domain-containing protein n=1 Tax=Loa loa TaxID=7209 RepID=A0A1I7VR99_LOALO